MHPIRTPARAYRREARALAELFARRRPGVVHTHGFRPDVQAGRVAGRAGVPRVTTLHGFTGGGARMRLYESDPGPERAALRGGGRRLAAPRGPHAARGRAGRAPAPRPQRLRPQRVFAPARRGPRGAGSPADAFAIGWVGRLSAEKGGDVFVKALASLADLPCVACVIGDGPERAALEARAAALGLGGRIRWCGVRPHAGRLFTAFDAYALSSRTEGTPIVLLEAMAAGVPIVATRVGGVPDVVGPEEAWLVASEDPRALAAALRELRADPAQAARRAESARRRLAAEFADAPWLDAYARIYGEARACRKAQTG